MLQNEYIENTLGSNNQFVQIMLKELKVPSASSHPLRKGACFLELSLISLFSDPLIR